MTDFDYVTASDEEILAFARSLDLRDGPPVHRSTHARLVPGGDFALDEPDVIPALWGDGDRVLWAEGEALMIAGAQGLGKTTLAQQLILARMGVTDGTFLGLTVKPSSGRSLYLAMDRPRQAARSIRRMITEGNRALMNEKLLMWKGPTGVDIRTDSSALADWVEEQAEDIDLVVFDSVKDLLPGLSDDAVGAAVNSAWQELIARGIEVLVLHHERKAQNGQQRTASLDNIYGSTWLTSGLGSVIQLSGTQGDPEVMMHHLKQPAEEVGPLQLVHDHKRGGTTVRHVATVESVLRGAGMRELTVKQIAVEADVVEATARRRVNALVAAGTVIEATAASQSSIGKTAATYRWVF